MPKLENSEINPDDEIPTQDMGEIHLMRAVLESALEELDANSLVHENPKVRAAAYKRKEAAIEWIQEERFLGIFTFNSICLCLNYDAACVRKLTMERVGERSAIS